MNRIVFSIIIYTMCLSAMSGCKETTNSKTKGHKEVSDEHHTHDHEDENGNTTTLSLEQIKAVGITYSSVELKELTAVINANGNLKVPNNNKANATSLYGGAVKTIQVEVGDYVKKGQVIATIANPQFIQLQEEYMSIESRLTFAQQEQERQVSLVEGNAGARKNLQSATAELNSLKARKSSLYQQIKMMGINPSTLHNGNLKSTLTVLSPLSGTISNVFAKIGSYVDVSSPVAEIVDNGSLHLDLQVFEKDMPLIKVGQVIHFTLTNNPLNEYDAIVYSIGSAFESESKTIPVHCKVKGNINGLIDGMNIRAIVSLSNAVVPAVPNNAIVEADGKYFIFVRSTHKDAVVVSSNKQQEGADHHHNHNRVAHEVETEAQSFIKIEVVKGVSNMGYTAITPIKTLPENALVVSNGAFFINAKMSNSGEHGHAH